MPLIGTIDSGRAQQVIETLLEGVATTRATTAILDITGIRPEVAQTLVGLGLDLSTIVTRSSLQSGISFALADRTIGDNSNRMRHGYN